MASYDYSFPKIQGLGEDKRKRGIKSKTFNLKKNKLLYVGECKPVHYTDMDEKRLRTIDLTILDDYSGNLITTKHQASLGFRDDLYSEKMMGIRHGNDRRYQFEITPHEFIINGKELKIPNKFTDIKNHKKEYSIENIIDTNHSIYNTISESGIKNIFISKKKINDFVLSYRLNTKGYDLVNPVKDGYAIPCKQNYFLFKKRNGGIYDVVKIKPPVLWSQKDQCPYKGRHSLKKEGNDYIYTKYSNEYIKKWIKDKNPLYIDTNSIIYSETGSGAISNSDSSWSRARSPTNDNNIFVYERGDYFQNAHFGTVSTYYAVYRGFFIFDTSILTSDSTIESAIFSIYSFNYNPRICGVTLQKGTQGTSLSKSVSDFMAFTGSPYCVINNIESADVFGGWNYFSLNQNGINNINKIGNTFYCTRNYQYDYMDVAPTAYYFAYGDMNPKLSIVYSLQESAPSAPSGPEEEEEESPPSPPSTPPPTYMGGCEIPSDEYISATLPEINNKEPPSPPPPPSEHSVPNPLNRKGILICCS